MYRSGDAVSASSSSCIRSLKFAWGLLFCLDDSLDMSIVDVVGLEASIKSCDGPGLIANDEVEDEAPMPA